MLDRRRSPLLEKNAEGDLKASIVINNYNYARFLSQAIESALGQTYGDTEVIVIDDGSTDGSAEIIKSYGNRIIPVFKNNGGQSSCYSRGFDFYLDVVDESGVRLDAVVPSGRLGRGTNPLKMMRLFGAYCSPPGSGNVYSRDFLNKILPMQNDTEFHRFEAMHFGGDSVPILAAPFFGTIAAIPQILGFYRRHTNAAGGVTSTFQPETSMRILKKEYEKDMIRDRAWRFVARQAQTPKLPEPSRLKRQMCYLRLAGRGLDPGDNRLNLSAKGVLSSIWWHGYSWSLKKLLQARVG